MKTKTLTGSTPDGRTAIMELIMTQAFGNTLMNLKDRWADEKEHEDFKEYKSVIEKAVLKNAPKGSKVLSITKAFNITLSIPEFPYNPIIYLNSRAIGWKSR